MAFGVHLRKMAITSGQSVSAYENIQGLKVIGVLLGSGWTAAALYFGASFDLSNRFDIAIDTSAVYSIATPAVNTLYWLRRANFDGLAEIALKSGTVAVPVNQGADRTIYLILQSLSS